MYVCRLFNIGDKNMINIFKSFAVSGINGTPDNSFFLILFVDEFFGFSDIYV